MIPDMLSWICIVAGGLVGIVGGIGINRFPDFFTRVHAVGVTDTLTTALFLLGLGLQAGFTLASFKLFLIFAFLFFTSPSASHSLTNAAELGGLKPKLATETTRGRR